VRLILRLLQQTVTKFTMSETTKTLSSYIDSVILSAFPRLSTRLNHTTTYGQGQSLTTQLFPHDCFVAALAISFNRYTVKYEGESKVSRIFWSALLGYVAWQGYDYWILTSLHFVSFSQYLFQILKDKFVTSKVSSVRKCDAFFLFEER
jgi:hypothetical protein